MAGKKELTYEIIKHYGIVSEKSKGWRREINSVSWNGAEPKFDIRDWGPDHEKMGKGITLTENELLNLMDIVNQKVFYNKDENEDLNIENNKREKTIWELMK